MGDNVSATILDMTTALAKVRANSGNKVPVKPPCNPIGA
jgi:hypothetical protein